MNATTPTPDLNSIARNQANKLRFVRQAIPPTDMPQGYVDSVAGHRVQRNNALSIRPNQHLQPLQMSRHFFLHKEQTGDIEVLTTAIEFAAADIAQAEDAVLLLGSGAKEFLAGLHVKLDNPEELRAQEGLFDHEVGKVTKPILDSITEGIQTLQQKGQAGDYYVIVSPDLYREAYTNRETPMDAPIYQIQPLLAKDGFLYSEAAPAKTGVIFSLARNTIKVAVPMDAYVEQLPDDENGRPRYRVAEQFRLVIDDPDARTSLK
jgi:uncharacterized linocin/CFP29 family protein